MVPRTLRWKDAMLGRMWGERWLGRWRSRSALFWAATSVIVFLVSGSLSASGQCEYFSYGDGTSLPIGYPWVPTTTAGRTALMRFITAMGITESVSRALIPLLTVGLLWARVVRIPVFLLVLVLPPALALLLQLPEVAVFLASPEYEAQPPLFMELAWAADFWSRPFTQASYLLVAAGLVALGLRRLLNRRAKPLQA